MMACAAPISTFVELRKALISLSRISGLTGVRYKSGETNIFSRYNKFLIFFISASLSRNSVASSPYACSMIDN